MGRNLLLVPSVVVLSAGACAVTGEEASQVTNAGDNESGAVPYIASSCSGSFFPIGVGGSTQCCQDGTDIWHKSPSGRLTHRVTGQFCTLIGGSQDCTDNCAFGPCGAGGVTGEVNVGTTDAVVFHPHVHHTLCGRDSNGLVAGGAIEAPEPYTDPNAQPLYGPVTATCPFTRCFGGGVRGNDLTVTGLSDGAGTGTVSDNTFTWSLFVPTTGASTTAQIAEGQPPSSPGVITVSADPHGTFDKAAITGACTATGTVGQTISCNVTMDQSKSITVTFTHGS
jgi:hypothetical protein